MLLPFQLGARARAFGEWPCSLQGGSSQIQTPPRFPKISQPERRFVLGGGPMFYQEPTDWHTSPNWRVQKSIAFELFVCLCLYFYLGLYLCLYLFLCLAAAAAPPPAHLCHPRLLLLLLLLFLSCPSLLCLCRLFCLYLYLQRRRRQRMLQLQRRRVQLQRQRAQPTICLRGAQKMTNIHQMVVSY